MIRYLHLLMVLLCMSSWVWAETIPATANTGQPVTPSQYCTRAGVVVGGVTGPFCGDRDYAATKLCQPVGYPTFISGNYSLPNNYNFTYKSNSGSFCTDYVSFTCPSGSTPSPTAGSVSGCVGTSYSCPANQGWTLSGSTCTRPDCQSGYTRQDDGTCLAPCLVPVNEQIGAGSIYLAPVPVTAVCIQGCRAWIAGRTYTEAGQTYGQAWSYGEPCTAGTGSNSPVPEAPPAEQSCHERGMCSGTVNGQTICVTCDVTTSETKTTKTETAPGATSPTTTTTTRKTTCHESGTCTTTETTNSSGPSGNGTSTTTSTGPSPSTVPPGEQRPETRTFCQDNPNSPICKVTSFSGTCGAEPTCDGDAVQCEQAREAFKLRCALEPNVTNDGPITTARETDAAKEAYDTENQKIHDTITGALPDPSSASRSSWEQAMASGWFDTIPITGCQPQTYQIGSYAFHFDPCPVAGQISSIGSYALWISLLIGGFVFVTGGRIAGVR